MMDIKFRREIGWLLGGAIAAIFLMFPGTFLEGEVAVPAQMLYLFPPWSVAGIEVDPGNTLRSDIFDARLQAWAESSVTFSHLWSPGIQGGYPVSHVLISGHASPTAAPFLLLMSPGMAQHYAMLARLIIAFVGTYLLLRKLGCHPALGFVGGLGFALGGFNSVWMPWSHVAVASFGPWLLLSVEVIREKRLIGTILLAGSTYGLVAGGFPAVASYYLYLTAAYIFFLLLLPVLLKRQYREALLYAVACGGGVVLAFGLAGVYLLSVAEFLSFVDISNRPVLGRLRLANIPQLVLPFFNGNQAFASWIGPGNYNETTGYIGIVVMAGFFLSPLAVWLGARRAKQIFFLGAALVIFSIIYNIGPLLRLAVQLPALSTGANTRMLSILGFCLIMGGALTFQTLFVDRWETLTQSIREKWLLFAVGLVLLLGFMLLAGFIIGTYRFDEIRAFSTNLFGDTRLLTRNIFWLRIVNLLLAIGLVTFALWGLIIGAYTKRTWIPIAAIMLVMMIDMGVFNFRQNPTVPAEAVFPMTPGIDFLQEQVQNDYERTLAIDDTFFHPGAHVIYDIPSTVSHAFLTSERRAFVEEYLGEYRSRTAIRPDLEDLDLDSRLLNLAGTAYITLSPGTRIAQQSLEQPINNYPIIMSSDGTPIEQTFEIDRGNIDEICIRAATYQRVLPQGEGSFTVTLMHDGEIVAQAEHDLAVLGDNQVFCSSIEADETTDSLHTVSFQRSSEPDLRVALWANRDDPYAAGAVSGPNVPDETDLVFEVIYSQNTTEIDEQFELIYEGEDLTIYHNREALYGYITNQVRVSDDIEQTLDYLETETEIVVVDQPVEVTEADACYTEITPASFSNDKVIYELDGGCAGILATSEVYYPGWQIEVDGEPREMLRVNGIFRGVEVTEDDTTVVFRYWPQTFVIGGVISSLSLVGFIALCVIAFKPVSRFADRRREDDQNPADLTED